MVDFNTISETYTIKTCILMILYRYSDRMFKWYKRYCSLQNRMKKNAFFLFFTWLKGE